MILSIPRLCSVRSSRWFVVWNITTSKGPATTIEFALELVRLLKGMEKAAEVSTALLYMA